MINVTSQGTETRSIRAKPPEFQWAKLRLFYVQGCQKEIIKNRQNVPKKWPILLKSRQNCFMKHYTPPLVKKIF